MYRLISLIILIISFGCHQKITDEGIKHSSKIESVKTLETIFSETNLREEPAVIYRSIDLGKTWSTFDNGIPIDATLSGITQYDNKLYVATDYHGVYLATNGKNTWAPLNAEELIDLDINCIEVEKENIMIGTFNKGILVSNDGGVNWNSSKQNINSPIRAFVRLENNIYAGTDSGIYKSDDWGLTWTHAFWSNANSWIYNLKRKDICGYSTWSSNE